LIIKGWYFTEIIHNNANDKEPRESLILFGPGFDLMVEAGEPADSPVSNDHAAPII